jgi:hypothetical protein
MCYHHVIFNTTFTYILIPLSQQSTARKAGFKSVQFLLQEENRRLCVSKITGFGYKNATIIVMHLTIERKYPYTQNSILCHVYR